MKIWITGLKGMLAQDLEKCFVSNGHVVIGTDRELDICDESAVRGFLGIHDFDALVNCAAYTAVDLAETEEDKANAVNAQGVGVLAEATAQKKIPMLHISTDYVLNGTAPTPLQESAPIDPCNAYGRSKAKGELRLQAYNPKHWIVRTAWLYGIHGKNFVKTMLQLMESKDSLRVIEDQWGTPTWTRDLSDAIVKIVESGDHFGVYHFSGSGKTNWADFARSIQKNALDIGLLNRRIPIEGIPTSEYPTPAKRPNWSVLDKSAIQTSFGIIPPPWESSLMKYLQEEVTFRAK